MMQYFIRVLSAPGNANVWDPLAGETAHLVGGFPSPMLDDTPEGCPTLRLTEHRAGSGGISLVLPPCSQRPFPGAVHAQLHHHKLALRGGHGSPWILEVQLHRESSAGPGESLAHVTPAPSTEACPPHPCNTHGSRPWPTSLWPRPLMQAPPTSPVPCLRKQSPPTSILSP